MTKFSLILLVLLCGCVPSFLVTPVQNVNKLEEVTVEKGTGGAKVAMIEVEGLLINARVGGFLQPQENKLSLFTEQLERAEKDSAVKAVVLRVNSPGGTVSCSDAMYEMLKAFKAKTRKPVVACAQEVMASGAFYVSSGCDSIVAQPTSVVGSIGVIFETFEVSETMTMLGIRSNTIKSGPMKDSGSPFRPMNPEDRAVMQSMIDEYYNRFVAVVQDKAHIKDGTKLKIATDGRVFTGMQAKEIGLVDQLGYLPDAIKLAQAKAGVSNARVVMYKRPLGYHGSIYADTNAPVPQTNGLQLSLPESTALLPRGFYYLWQP